MTVLADTSVMIAAQRRRTSALAVLTPFFEGDDLWTCAVVRLELLRGANNPRHMKVLNAQLEELRNAPIDEDVWRRATEVYEGLARLQGGRHRGVEPSDVLIAAAAEAHELAVLHDDAHFDLIAEVTGQDVVRIP
ncbi:MAG TPA: PIN domain-containing protein [Solirubrobacteraceae bacterium]|nr:PIN domain-containing protein [Solirubrobacteraceae bacterium]